MGASSRLEGGGKESWLTLAEDPAGLLHARHQHALGFHVVAAFQVPLHRVNVSLSVDSVFQADIHLGVR